MPVRSLSSSILKWPEPPKVLRALQDWVEAALPKHQEILRLGYFGSYAKGDWGVGSDLDIVIIVKSSTHPFERRAMDFDVTRLPVPVDLLIYTEKEWQRLLEQGKWQQATKEIIWIYLSK
ncbi:MAG: nucleotidyltransferase domain-containing protein [Dehalococcoidia bacterium]|nr:hypothetical protein [Chloroflexota bacterium]MBT9162594.1 hypothetical protein [Chloroflexota bacterium]